MLLQISVDDGDSKNADNVFGLLRINPEGSLRKKIKGMLPEWGWIGQPFLINKEENIAVTFSGIRSAELIAMVKKFLLDNKIKAIKVSVES